jgi:outer membrane protein TolC
MIRKVALATVFFSVAGWPLLAQLPQVRIGVLLDGPSGFNQQSIEVLKAEIQGLLEEEYEVVFPPDRQLVADWTASGVRRNLGILLDDPDLDQVVAFGIMSSSDMARRGPLSKPSHAGLVFDPVLQRIPFEILEEEVSEGELKSFPVSGVKNLSYTLIGGNFVNQMEAFREIVPFKELTVLFPTVLSDLGFDLEPELETVMAPFDLQEINVLYVGTSAQDVLTRLSEDEEAVALGPLPQLPSGELSVLISGLNQRRIPTFSYWGRAEIEKGVLASLGVGTGISRRARRIALNIQQVLEGAKPEEIDTSFSRREQLVINMETADAIGVSPKYTTLLEADLLNTGISAQRTLSLPAVVREASSVNLEIAAAARRVEAARQRTRQAKSGLLPQFGIGGSATLIDRDRARVVIGQGEQQYVASLGADQLIYSDRVWANFGIAKNLRMISDEERAELRLDIVLEAAESYLNVLRAETVRRIQLDNLSLTKRNLDLAQSRVEIGIAGRDEIFRWEIEVATNQTAVIKAEALANQATIAVNRVLNRPLREQFSTVEATLNDPELTSSFEAIGPYIDSPGSLAVYGDFMTLEALVASPELRQLDGAIRIQEREVLAGKRSYYFPEVSFFGDLTAFQNKGAGSDLSFGIPGFPSMNNTNWAVGFNASIPLFTSGNRSGKLAEARETLQELQFQRTVVKQRVEELVRALLYEANSAFVSISLTERAARAARDNLQLVGDSYAAGVVDILRLLDAQNEALTADLGSANAVFDYLLSLMGVQRSIGRFDYYRSAQERQEFLDRLSKFFEDQGQKVRTP